MQKKGKINLDEIIGDFVVKNTPAFHSYLKQLWNDLSKREKNVKEGPDGDIYEGYFDKSLFHGQGKYIYHNSQNEYDGEFQYGIKKGKGKYIAMNEYTYDGNWDNDIPFGYGKLTTWDNTCILKCTFRAGKIAEEPIYEIGSKDNFNQDNFEIKPEEMKLDTRNLTHLEVPKIEATEYKLGGNVSFLDE